MARTWHLITEPKALHWQAGNMDLSSGVRLETVGLSADQRELCGALVEEAGLQSEDGGVPLRVELGIRLPDTVPAAAAEDYYELEAAEGGISIGAAHWAGLVWGVRTLEEMARQQRMGLALGSVRIRDWPDLPHRGLFVEDKWGPDRMGREEWFRCVDRLSRLKMNRLGVGLYGCWGSCRYEPGPHGRGWPTEFLMVPVPEHPNLRSRKRLRWYSPREDSWRDETYLPRLFAEDFLGELVDYARRRGVTVIPFVNSLGHNTLIPRQLPQVSARDEQGNPLGVGYCLSSPHTREFLETFYGGIVDRYFAGTAPFFHIQMDEVWADHPDPDDPLRRVEPWCQCPSCRSEKRERLLQEHILWLAEMLTRRGVDQVVMWNDQLTRHMDALDQAFVERLRERGLDQRLILHWWWYSNDALNERTRVAIGRRQGLRGWVAPMGCYFNWQMYSPRLPNIELMLRMAREEGGEGAVAYAVHDPGWSDHDALLAGYSWNGGAMPGWESREEQWAYAAFSHEAPAYLAALSRLRSAAATPALGTCYAYSYAYVREGKPFPRAYPGEALEALGAVEDAPTLLDQAADVAAAAEQEFARLAEVPEMDREALLSLRGECARIRGLGRVFAFLTRLHGQPDSVRPEQAAECAEVRRDLVDAMRQVEIGKPAWVVPASLQALSQLLAFLEQLEEELKEAAASGVAAVSLHWTLTRPYAEEEEDDA